ncbi:NinF family protein [Cronobacter sakazakii]|uniref:protein NinF n=1 Tax=Cronobacter sakazakii TaxID=28141 RepID=UPI002A2B92A8|nr:protein NinF [Cronobacter sakazakii]EIX1502329.1 NinF family protein [Cronobacter sakazakii]EIX1525348.1 NinF family protein [Cronobacter sakazakii]EIX1533357.1 NinF family protein [Cronobacter sakazakii]EIX1621180.1 NinF family protein [Cronobacter sakazakii]EIX1662402.1 NinF family protein [Cronobacter sakazakii]
MLSPIQTQTYEQQSIARALCAGCSKQLEPDETYACGECINEWLVYRDPNHFVAENEDESSSPTL